MGKTRAAIRYAYKFSDSYRTIVFLDASSGETVRGKFVKTFEKFQLKNIEKVENCLTRRGRLLLIFDNVISYETIKKLIPDKADIIVTSIKELPLSVKQIKLVPMKKEEYEILIEKHLKLSRVKEADEEQAMTYCVSLFQGNPLIIIIACRTMLRLNWTFQIYMKEFFNNKKNLLNLEKAFPHDYNSSLFVGFKIILTQIKNIKSQFLLTCMSVLYSKNVPKNFLELMFLTKFPNEKDALLSCMVDLVDWNLISVEDDYVNIHDLLQYILQCCDELKVTDNSDQEIFFQTAEQYYNTLLDDEGNAGDKLILLPHIYSLMCQASLEKWKKPENHLANILIHLIVQCDGKTSFFSDTGTASKMSSNDVGLFFMRLALRFKLYSLIRDQIEKFCPVNDELWQNHPRIQSISYSFRNSLEYKEVAVNLLRYTSDNLEISKGYCLVKLFLGAAYYDLERYKDAKTEFIAGLHMLNDFSFPREHPVVMMAKRDLGICCRILEHYTESVIYLSEAYIMAENHLPESHFVRRTTAIHYACALYRNDDPENARKIYREHKDVLYSNHEREFCEASILECKELGRLLLKFL